LSSRHLTVIHPFGDYAREKISDEDKIVKSQGRECRPRRKTADPAMVPTAHLTFSPKKSN
jgi:hypothetical protein